jgi:hypothetical protein
MITKLTEEGQLARKDVLDSNHVMFAFRVEM